jgi:hypothetical protein
LTSILFLPFYSNIIKAVKAHEGDGERKMRVIVSREEKQFVTVYHFEKGRKNVCAMCGVGKKQERRRKKSGEDD